MPSNQNQFRSGLSGEERLIERYFKPLATAPTAFGLGDDAATFTPPAGCDLVLTTDGVIAGVHFLPGDPPQSIARKALRMNLSDLAAKGATPAGFLLSIALPASTPESWIAAFAEGLGQDINHYGCPLLGVLIHRDADLAKKWRLSSAASEHLQQRYLLPQPRNALADTLRAYASAAIDVSDGLAGDLAKLCRASGLAAEIEIVNVPLSDAARAALSADPTLIERILTGGDDYEILFTLPAAKLDSLRAAAAHADVPLAEIGQVTTGQGVRFLREGKVLSFAQPSYSHF